MKRAAAIGSLHSPRVLRSLIVLLGVLAIAFAAGCGDGAGTELRVRVVTGLVPGPEFNRTETLIMRPGTSGDAIVQRAESVAHFGMAFARGVEVANFPNAPTGDVLILVRAFTPQGDVLLEQRLRTELTGSRSVTLFLDRACIAVTCPSPGGSANLNACLAGQCVDPRCDPTDESTREFCPNVTFCNLPSECSPVADCAEQLCVEGVCVTEQLAAGTSDEACEDGLWCDPTDDGDACAPVPDSTLAQDAGTDAAVCGTICFASSDPCSVGYWACDGDAGPVCTGFVFVPSGTSCGNGGTCDSAGVCIEAADGGASEDAGNDADGGTSDDASVSVDASTSPDAFVSVDASVGMDAAIDMGVDAGIDAAIDATVDASLDASAPVTASFLKASNAEETDLFGWSVAISGDGLTLAVGAPRQDGDSASNIGAVYVFTKSGDTWAEQARVEAANAGEDDEFGHALSLSYDGDTLAIGAPGEDGSHRGRSRSDEYELALDGPGFFGVDLPTGEQAYRRSVVVHPREDGALVDESNFLVRPGIYIPADATDITFAPNGDVSCFVGPDPIQLGRFEAYAFAAPEELAQLNGYFDRHFRETAGSGPPMAASPGDEGFGSLTSGVIDRDDDSGGSGAVYVYRRSGDTWSEDAYVKPSNTRSGARFGAAVSLSHDGTRLAVGAPGEDSAQSNTPRITKTPFAIDGNGFFAVQLPDGNLAYTRDSNFVVDMTGTVRTPEGFMLMPMLVIPENTSDLRISFDGQVSVYSPESLARQTIGAINITTFIQPNELRQLSARFAHMFVETAESGSPTTSSPNADGAGFVYVRDAFDTSVENAGAAYVFDYVGDNWTQSSYAKASVASSGAAFGTSVALGSDGNTLVVGAPYESVTTPVVGTEVLPSIEIDGAGYFMVRLLDGNTGYTKNNDFSIGEDGSLLLSGLPLTNSIVVPLESTSVEVTLLGVVEVRHPDYVDPLVVGQIELANFANPAGLQNEGGGIFTETPESNPPLVSQPGSSGLGYIYAETSTATLNEVGAAYVFVAAGRDVAFGAPVRIADEEISESAYFGYSVALSETDVDEATSSFIAIGAPGANTDAGAVSVYSLRGTSLNYDAFIDAATTESGDRFGSSVAFSGRGGRLLIGAPGEDSAATRTGGDGSDNSAPESGAVYVFEQDGIWYQLEYIKGFASDPDDNFGHSVCFDSAGTTYAVGAPYEDSSQRSGLRPGDNSNTDSGAVVVGLLSLD